MKNGVANTPSTYSRVIFKNYNDKEAEEMVNSYNYSHKYPLKYKKWSPDLSYEERYKKKRNREDEYINNFHRDDRPILLIKKKHEYKGINNPQKFKDLQDIENYYKISENT